MSDWSQELAKAKAERRTPAPDRMPPNMKPAAKKRKKPKARFHVMWQSNLGGILKGGMVVGRYKTMEEALACIERKVRSAYVSGLYCPSGTPIDDRVLLDEQAKRRARYWVKDTGE